MPSTDERLFADYLRTRDPRCLGQVFDRTADELLRVAGCLCAGDRSLVEDALQATFLTAITDAESFDPRRRLRPWLLGILANHVRRERRARRRAAGLGDAPLAVLSGPVPAADEAVADELRTVLARSLSRLPSPYREVLVLHLDHGLDSAEIGRALDRSPSTVRTQIARGLERLRTILPAGLTAGFALSVSPEALASVRRAVLAHAMGPGAPVPSVSQEVARAGGRKLLMSLGAACAFSVLGTAWLWTGGASDPLSVPSAPAVAGVASRPARAVPVSGGDRTPVSEPPPAASPAAPADTVVIEVVRKDPPGPVVGAMVALGIYIPGFPLSHEPQDVRHAITDARGHATFPDVPDVPGFSADLVGTDCAQSFAREAGEPPRLVVDGGHELTVRVVDAAGQPVAGATVMTDGGAQLNHPWRLLGHTDAAGVLLARHQSATTQLVAWAPGRAPSQMADLQLFAGKDRNQCTLRLDRPGHALDGRVLDERNQPVPGAVVAVVAMGTWPPVPVWLRSDREGWFRADWLPTGHVALVAQHAADGVVRTALVRTDLAGPTELDLRLGSGGSVRGQTGRLVRAGGAITIPTISARFLPDAIHGLPLLSTYTLAQGGRYRLDGLLPGRWRLTAQWGGTRLEHTVTVRAGDELEWQPTLPEVVSLRVALRDAQGRPLTGWRVSTVNDAGFPSGSGHVTDAAGEVGPVPGWEFPLDQPIGLLLHAPLAEGEWDPFPTFLVPRQPLRDEALVVTVADRLRPTRHVLGALRMAAAAPLPAWRVLVRHPRAPGSELTATATGERTFRAGPLTPGRYQVSIAVQGLPELELGEVQVPADRDLDLGEIPVGAFGLVRVRLAADQPTRGLELLLVSERGQAWTLDRQPDQSFTERVPHGRYTLRGHAAAAHVAARTVVVDREQVGLEVAVAPCPTLQLTMVLPEDGDRSQASWSGTVTVRDARDAVVLRTSLARMFWGRWQARLGFPLGLPPGRYHVEVQSWDQRLAVGDGVVTEAGGALDLPLR